MNKTQQDAKQAFLNKQQEQMLALYQNADTSERNAIIKQIDSFLSVISEEQRAFWLEFRQKLEKLNQSAFLFPLGNVYLTIGAQEALEESNQLPIEFLSRHQEGDWGIVGKDDWKENDFSLSNSFRLLSAYKTAKDVKIWLITEADRSVTTILLPCEY